MATTLFILIIIFTLFFPPPILSKNPLVNKDTIFDVSASTQKTKHLLTFNPQLQQTPYSSSSSSSSSPFILSLHPRSSLHKTHHKNYRSLTLSRLARDSARTDSLIAKLEFALTATKLINHSHPNSIKTSNLQSPVTSGIRQGSGEYFTRLGVGTPTKQYYMVIDTGSDINWLQCEPCSRCYDQSDLIFNPSDSSSYAAISCDSPQCSSLDISFCSPFSDTCLYEVSYGDGSFTAGNFATETVSFGTSGSVPNIAIGCGHDNEGLFVGSAGLIGLGGDLLSLPSQMKAKSFSYCLVDRDSTKSSTLEFNSVQPADSVTAPLLRNPKMPTFFYIGLTGISVGGNLLPLPSNIFEINESGRGGTIIDSGTAITRLTTQAYNSLRDSFVKLTNKLPMTSGFLLFDTCYDLSSLKKISVPTVTFHFKGSEALTLKANNYMVPVDSNGKYCFAFAPSLRSLSIIGNVQQQGIRVSYDIAKSLVGFSSDKC